MNIIEGNLSLDKNAKIAIISARFNHLITDRLVEGAKDAFDRHGGIADNLTHILVPGAFELPISKTAHSCGGFSMRMNTERSWQAESRVIFCWLPGSQ